MLLRSAAMIPGVGLVGATGISLGGGVCGSYCMTPQSEELSLCWAGRHVQILARRAEVSNMSDFFYGVMLSKMENGVVQEGGLVVGRAS